MREQRLRELYRSARAENADVAEMLQIVAGEHAVARREMSPIEAQIFTKLAETLLDRAGLLDRFAFARDVSGSPLTPPAVVKRLLDDDHLVASTVIQAAPFNDVQLLELITAPNREPERVQTAVARRPLLSRTITGVLVGKGRPEVLTALAANPGAELSRASLEAMCDMAVRQSVMGKALARRADLPAEISGMLNRRLEVGPLVDAPLSESELLGLVAANDDEAEQVAIAWRSPLSSRVSDALIDNGRPRVLLTLAGNAGAKISPRGFDVLAAVATDHSEMDEALARRTDLPPVIAKRLHKRLSDRMRERIDELILRDRNRQRRPFVLRHA